MTIYRPGQLVPVSGIYNVVDRYGNYAGRQVTCVEREPFPPTYGAVEYGFALYQQTVHRGW